jgi:hypothetical protein
MTVVKSHLNEIPDAQGEKNLSKFENCLAHHIQAEF